MGTGFLKVQATTADEAMPVPNARVIVQKPDGTKLYEAKTDENGSSEVFSLSAPDKSFTLDPNYTEPAYSICDVIVSAPGFITRHIHGVEIVDTQTAILPVHMSPVSDDASPSGVEHIYIPEVGLLIPGTRGNPNPPPMGPDGEITRDTDLAPLSTAPESRVLNEVIIPDYITVHLGRPSDSTASNVRVRFIDYIKNVTSSEIYPTWPYNSLVANIHAIVTFTLNRVFTEWYRSRNYNFDITNSTQFDMAYRYGGPVFENISQIVDGIFNVYAHRYGFLNPFFTQFCNGTTATCPGLTQWGTVTLANQGMTPLQILRHFYPNDLELTASNNIRGITSSYPGYPLEQGSSGENVRSMQNFLNRIRVNYPAIPLISNPNGNFDGETTAAVTAFQRIFNLTADGVIGRNTWNRILYIYVAVTRMAELDAEGVRVSIGRNPPNVVLQQGSRGAHVRELQFILNSIAPYHPAVPRVINDGVFGAGTRNSVIDFQRAFGLTPDGVVGPTTWARLYSVYRGVEDNVPHPPPP
ncbi:MAG: peptidoglycan-binding protein, partial [Oscillospiraceae bacterium]|nr:peptidoglycan-binding protein [Oscillospiraceae bacterium]